jgi:acyl-homoserine-lactone acylase
LSREDYLANTNNAYFEVPGSGDNLKPEDYPKTMGYGVEENNRSIMAHYLISKYDKVSYDDFKKIKFNRTFNDSMYDYIIENLGLMWKLDPIKYPDIADAIEVVKSWNHETDVNNKEASLVSFAIYQLADKVNAKGRIYDYNSFPESVYVDALREAKKHMLKYFGSLRVPLGEVQKHVRGDKVLPVGGGPEVIAATITQPWKDGMRKTAVGESYIQLVRYSKDSVQIESINAYGASAKPNSPHYTDQMDMYVHQQLKPMTLDKATIYRDAERIYHPVKGNDQPQDLSKK